MQILKGTRDNIKQRAVWGRSGNGLTPSYSARGIVSSIGLLRRTEEKVSVSMEDVLRSGPAQESLRYLYDRILAGRSAEGGTFSITSAVSGEGKTTVAVALASLMADDLEKTVVIVDCSFRSPHVHEILGVPLVPGLAGCIRRECTIEEATRQVGRLWVLPAGEEPNASRLARSGLAPAVMDEVRKAFDIAIVDLPSISEASETAVMATWADGLVMVIRADSTSVPAVSSAIESIPREKLLGVVLNQQRSRIPGWLDKLI